MNTQFYESEFLLNGEKHTLAQWQETPIIIVNTATKCGFATQFDGLQKLHEAFKEQGLIVIAFPCDQFRHQEPESDENMAQVCQLNFGVTFPIAHKIAVNGDSTHPIYQFLKHQAPGLFGSEKIKWNFTKFLISANGQTVKRYAPSTEPKRLIQDIKRLLPS
ncbi:MAG: glutathione peroxidase [Psychromonas sp.]